MKTACFDYSLPSKFIAQRPVTPRDSSKLMIYDTKNNILYHKKFRDIVNFLRNDDVLVLNCSKVIPARIIFYENKKEREVFILKKLGNRTFSTMVRPGKYFKLGKKFFLTHTTYGEVLDVQTDGTRVIEFNKDIKKLGQVPTPPYIKNKNIKFSQYQTIYAKKDGSVAAPTAGFHFTKRLLNQLKSIGIKTEKIVLHIGRGTFSPVSATEIENHVMHSEYFEFSPKNAEFLNKIKSKKSRVIAVGTTSVRVLETCSKNGCLVPKVGETDIFIYPGGHKWKSVDAMVTNFHLPKSTLIMLVASFLEHKGVKNPVKKILDLYKLAKSKKYRFYSFGDAMFIF